LNPAANALILGIPREEVWALRYATCRRGKVVLQPQNAEDIEEIQEEDAAGISLLEEHLPQLVEGYWTSGLSLVDYLDGPFDARIARILAADRRLRPEHLEAIEAIGVRIDAVDEDEDTEPEYEQ